MSSEHGNLDSLDTSLYTLLLGIAGTNEMTTVQWSRPIRIEKGIVRQSVFLQTANPEPPLAIVAITIIENDLIKVILTEDKVPRMLLSNNCSVPIQLGQCPTDLDRQNAKKTRLSDRDVVVSENLEQYTSIPCLDSHHSVYYEAPVLRKTFLTKKPQIFPKVKFQVLKDTRIKKKGNTNCEKSIYMPQGWSDDVDISTVGKTSLILPGNTRLHLDITMATSFLTHVVISETCFDETKNEDVEVAAEIKVDEKTIKHIHVYIYLKR